MDICSALHLTLENFRVAETYCDVRVRVQDKRFPCHRLVLASVSEYFHALFGGRFKDRDDPETVLEDIDDEAFAEILRCIYTGQTCRITPSNIFNLLAASVYLRISATEQICTKYIIEKTSLIQGHVPMFVFVRAMSMTALADVVGEYMVNNFALFYDDETLVEVTFDDLKFLLNKWSQNKSPFKEEDIMLHFLTRWVLHDAEERRKYVMELTAMVNFEKISTAYVVFMTPFFKYFTDRPTNLEEMPSLNLSSWTEKCDHNVPFENCHDDGVESVSAGLWLKEKLSENFAANESLSANLEQEMPASFYSQRFYNGNALGLHLHVEYFSAGYSFKKFKDTKLLSYSKYCPGWLVSGETDKWHHCVRRMSTYLESTNSLYCLEHYEDERNLRNPLLQKFCLYSSIDLNSTSHTLSPAPIHLGDSISTSMCVTPQNDVYLSASYRFSGTNTLPDLGVYYRYDRGVNEWFPVPKGEEYWGNGHPSLAAHKNLIYSIAGGVNQAYDYRSGHWTKLPFCNRINYDSAASHSCVLNDKVYACSGKNIEYFDTIGGKWITIHRPQELVYNSRYSLDKMLTYENSLFFLYSIGNKGGNAPDYQLVTFNTTSNEWYICDKSLRSTFESVIPIKSDRILRITDMFTFKT